jgi:hypothetical protein
MRKVRFVSILWIVLIVSNIYAATPQKHLIHRPASSEHIKPFSKAAYQTRAKEYAINNIASETFSDNIEPIQTGLNIIDISSNITTNTIWTSNNIYHILNAIEVNGAMLVIEPGTTVTFAGGGSDAGIKVLNGGTLIARGTGDNPILFTSDSSTPDYDDYYYAAYIDETASTATQFTYCIVEWAYSGIALFNIDLDTNIENNYFMACVWGITEYGTKHTDIINNLCFGSGYCGIYVNMKSLSDVSDADSIIKIQNNTCDYQECGITIYGADDFDTAGSVELKNNIVSEASDYGISLWDYLYITANNNGYYNNYSNTNSFPEYDPIEVFETPYVYGTGDYDLCYLNQNCAFIDGGLHYVEETGLIGQATAVDGTPDSNKIDIGFHYPNWDYSNAGSTTLAADFDNSLRVDYNDLAFFADYWLFDYNEAYEVLYWDYEPDGRIDFMDLAYLLNYWPDYFNFEDFADFALQWRKEVDDRLFDGRYDLNEDSIVNFEDFAILAGEWQQTAEGNPAISVNVSGDVNNLKGEIGISVGGCPYSTLTTFIFMDGQLMGQTDYQADEGLPGITINTPSYLNGDHLLKAVIVDKDGLITLSGNLAVDFNNPVHCLNLEDTYEPNQPLRLLGFSATESNLQIKLSKWNGDLVWSQQTSGDLNINIPGNVLAGQIYDVSIEQEIGGVRLMDSGESWESIYRRAVNAEYDPNRSYQFVIILPSAWGWNFPAELYPRNSINSRKRAVAAMVNYCDNAGIPYIILYEDNCTWDNFVKVLAKPTVCYAYVASRGASSIYNTKIQQSVQRTWFKLSNGKVLSHINYGEEWDRKTYSMASLGYGGSNKFKFVWIDVCLNGYYNDMANAWIKDEGQTYGALFVSWWGLIQYDDDSDFCSWTKFFWDDPDGWGVGGSNTYFQAFTRAQIKVHDGAWISGKVNTYGNIYNFRFMRIP